jgi:hypothetical protein
MKTKDILTRKVQNEIRLEPQLIPEETNIFPQTIKPLKMLIFATGLVGMGLLFNSCMGGYIASEPSYVEYSRPQRLTETQIWIDGDWGYNRQSNVYVQKAGYWGNPRQGQTYVSGSWQTNAHGKSWSKGRWQSNGHRNNNRNR